MKAELTIGKRFIYTSGTLLVLSVVLAFVSVLGFNRVEQNINSLATDSIPAIVYSESLKSDANELRSNYVRHILGGDASKLQQLEKSIQTDRDSIAANLKGYEGQINDEADRQRFEALKPDIDAVYLGWDKVLPLSRAGNQADALSIYAKEISPRLTSLRTHLDEMSVLNKQISDATAAQTLSTAQTSGRLTMMVSLLAIVLGVGLSWKMISSLNQTMSLAVSNLSQGADEVQMAASQVSSSTQGLAQGASEQAAAIEEISASSAEINSMARKNTDNTRLMSDLMQESQEMYTKTEVQLEDMVSSMNDINQSSGKISKIIKVIDEIAFQTNILSLNAAVEAARAGESGMGFAVVADEVRNLAQRSAQAAKDTAELIEDSIGKSNKGKTKVDEVAGAIRTITDTSSRVKALVDEVTKGSVEQSRELDQISKAISQMEQVTQSFAAGSEESAAAAEELSAQAVTMKEVVVRLNSLVTSDDIAGPQKSTLMGRFGSRGIPQTSDSMAM